MNKEFICIMCPQGCDIRVVLDGEIIKSIEGNRCPKGRDYITGEITNPQRNIATSVLVEGGDSPLASVRLSRPIPKVMIFDVMKEIRNVKVPAPAAEGQKIIEDVLGTGADVIITRSVERIGQ